MSLFPFYISICYCFTGGKSCQIFQRFVAFLPVQSHLLFSQSIDRVLPHLLVPTFQLSWIFLFVDFILSLSVHVTISIFSVFVLLSLFLKKISAAFSLRWIALIIIMSEFPQLVLWISNCFNFNYFSKIP